MLSKPSTCRGCALEHRGSGFMRPQVPQDGYKVLLLGEALGADEASAGVPFVGRSGFRLTRLIEWAGFDRSKFSIANAVWCRPPDNRLEGTPDELPAVAHCRAMHWGHLLASHHVVVPMGNVPTNALLNRKGIMSMRGYVYPGVGYHVLPTLHPSYIARGQSKLSAAVINDLQKAVRVAKDGIPCPVSDFLLDPRPMDALQWAKRVMAGRPTRIAYDIETPYKSDDEAEVTDDDDPTYRILRIGFGVGERVGISVPWSGEYLPAIRLLLENAWDKVVWNSGFDTPRIVANNVGIGGTIHDGMVAWHILHSDLPKGLAFVATFCCPWQGEWKSLSNSRPAYYNCTDAVVEWEAFREIEGQLHLSNLWDVYERDVLRVDPILAHMSKMGMPVDLAVRQDRALRLATEQVGLMTQIEALVPQAARRVAPKGGFKNEPKDTTGLTIIEVQAPVKRCSICRAAGPTKAHFRSFKRPTEKRPQNPCAAGVVVTQVETVTRFARLDPFRPSREQLIRYHQVLNRAVPMRKDKKTGTLKPVFDEMVLKQLEKKYPKDAIYGTILKWREADKLSGTYIGKVEGKNG